MKALVCEMCGANDLVKHDGMYVCQSCGTKYTTEEARKLMIEGTVDVQGTVKIDNSETVQKYLQSGRRARMKLDWEGVEKYYRMVEEQDPSNIEAIFYSTYPSALKALGDVSRAEREENIGIFSRSIQLINDYVDTDNMTEIADLLSQMNADIDRIIHYNFSYDTPMDKVFTEIWLNRLEGTFIVLIENIAQKSEHAALYKILIEHYKNRIENKDIDKKASKNYQNKMRETISKLKALEPAYSTTKIPRIKKSSGCYVATAIYGSYDCPQVWTLRRFRDYTLGKTWYGRTFIRTYYAISPTLVEWFGNTSLFKAFWKPKLDKLVKHLNYNGVENTPYND